MLITLQEAANYSSSTHSNESDSSPPTALTVGCTANSTIWHCTQHFITVTNIKTLFPPVVFDRHLFSDVPRQRLRVNSISFCDTSSTCEAEFLHCERRCRKSFHLWMLSLYLNLFSVPKIIKRFQLSYFCKVVVSNTLRMECLAKVLILYYYYFYYYYYYYYYY